MSISNQFAISNRKHFEILLMVAKLIHDISLPKAKYGIIYDRNILAHVCNYFDVKFEF